MGPFSGKLLSAVTLEDLKRLVDNAVSESTHLDFKRELSLEDKDQKKEFLRDLTSLANAQGGTIVYGIDEERDLANKPTGVAKEICGFTIANRDAFILTIGHLLKDGVDERLPSYEIDTVAITSTTYVLMLRVPSSIRAPHMVTLAGERRFFMRVNTGRQEMSTAQIRDSVLRTESLIERVDSFIRDRIAKWRSRSVAGPLWMLHVIPLSSDPAAIDVTDKRIVDRLLKVGAPTGGFHTHCLEGFKIGRREASGETNHAIFFRNGTVEFLDQSPFYAASQAFAYGTFYDTVFRLLGATMDLYREAHLNLPTAVVITLSGVANYRLANYPKSSEEDEFITDPIVVVDLPPDVRIAIRPAMDFLWNAFGVAKAEGFDDSGKYIGYRL